MTDDYLIGIDGGGSTVRVVIVTPAMDCIAEAQGSTANPNVVGKNAATQNITAAVQHALYAAGLSPSQIAAAGVGIAGASTAPFVPWLTATMQACLPHTKIVLSADYEIALVGAMAKDEGVLILAGTGSLAYGMTATGASSLVGGWGYLLGDEGSGYWLGLQALRAVTYAAEGRGPQTTLTDCLRETLPFEDVRDVISWVYGAQTAPTRAIGQLAPLVLEQAAAGDGVARSIVSDAVDHLLLAANTVCRQLDLTIPPVAFAGGLLLQPNPFSELLCQRLALESIPVPRYTPVYGAALLALLRQQKAGNLLT